MKKLLILISVLLFIPSFVKSESVKPTFGVTMEREVAFAQIEKKYYANVVVELKAADIGDYFVEGVKVIVKDGSTGERVYRKRFSKSYLYGFSDGTIQVGKGNALTQISLYKTDDGTWQMIIKEKGIY